MSTADFFDRQHTGAQHPLPFHFRLLRRFETRHVEYAERLLRGGRAMLDVGCGDGELQRRVASRYESIRACDVSPVVLEAARAHAHTPSNVTYELLDANELLPFDDGAFDAVVALGVIQYLYDPERFLDEARRVLRPGGTLVIEVPNVAYVAQRLRLLAGIPPRTSLWTNGLDGGTLHYFSVDLIRDLLVHAGFRIESIGGSGVLSSLRTWNVKLLCGNIIVSAEKR